MKRLLTIVVAALAVGAGAGLALRVASSRTERPDPPAVATRIRDVARLETLEVTLYKKVTFSPEPAEAASVWGDVGGWLRHTFHAPQGKAIVFADAHVGLDLAKLDASSIRVAGAEVWVVLPPLRSTIELRPGETEIIGSNLDSAETTRLLELAREAFQREVEADPALRERARTSAERAIRGLVATLGFEQVHFVETLPSAPAT